MSLAVPIEAQSHIDPSNHLNSIRRLADAVERGEIGMETLSSFVRAAQRGGDIRFASTRAVPLAIVEAIRANPDIPARQIVYSGVADDRWTWEDAERYESNAVALSERSSKSRTRPKTGVYLTRGRGRPRRKPAVTDMFVPKMSVDAVCRHDICDGAKACLALILALAGKASRIVTYTSSLATSLGRTARTVRNYFMELERVGLITRRPGRLFNTVEISISPACKPEPYVEPAEIKAFKLASRSGHPILSMMAQGLVTASMMQHPAHFASSGGTDRRKGFSVFNPFFESLPLSVALPRDGDDGGRRSRSEPVPPTTHSSLRIDPRRPINAHRGGTRAHWDERGAIKSAGALAASPERCKPDGVVLEKDVFRDSPKAKARVFP